MSKPSIPIFDPQRANHRFRDVFLFLMGIESIAESFGTAVDHGWWNACIPVQEGFPERPLYQRVDPILAWCTYTNARMLLATEVAEAIEAAREGKTLPLLKDEKGKPIGVGSELADVVIRIQNFIAGVFPAILSGAWDATVKSYTERVAGEGVESSSPPRPQCRWDQDLHEYKERVREELFYLKTKAPTSEWGRDVYNPFGSASNPMHCLMSPRMRWASYLLGAGELPVTLRAVKPTFGAEASNQVLGGHGQNGLLRPHSENEKNKPFYPTDYKVEASGDKTVGSVGILGTHPPEEVYASLFVSKVQNRDLYQHLYQLLAATTKSPPEYERHQSYGAMEDPLLALVRCWHAPDGWFEGIEHTNSPEKAQEIAQSQTLWCHEIGMLLREPVRGEALPDKRGRLAMCAAELIIKALAQLVEVMALCIRIAEGYGYDILQEVSVKQMYNRSRPYRHGGKAL